MGRKKESHILPLKCLRCEQLPSAAWHLPAAEYQPILYHPGSNMQAALGIGKPVIIVGTTGYLQW